MSLQARIDDVHRAVDEVALALTRVDQRIDDCLSNTSSCATTRTRTRAATSRPRSPSSTHQRNGLVVSAIQGRDYARIYAKEIDRGRSSITLSPEEQAAVHRAMAATLPGRSGAAI